jgi:hypothetical protein
VNAQLVRCSACLVDLGEPFVDHGVVSASRPSCEELAALVAQQAEQIAQLQAEVGQLRRRLGRYSWNSSKPPSTDSPFDKPAREEMRRHDALACRLIDRQDDCLRFTREWWVTADSNGCERDIRMIKLRRKISGCLRTITGGEQFCAIRSYLSTAAKHDKHFFNTLVMLAEGRPWMPAIR